MNLGTNHLLLYVKNAIKIFISLTSEYSIILMTLSGFHKFNVYQTSMNGTVFPTKTIQLCCTGILLDTINLINLIKLKQCNINLK